MTNATHYTFRKKALSVLLTVVMVFGYVGLFSTLFAPKAEAGTQGSYSYKLVLNCDNAFTGPSNSSYYRIDWSGGNTGNKYINVGGGSFADNGSSETFTGTLSNFPTGFYLYCKKDSGWIFTKGKVSATLYIYNNNTGAYVQIFSGSTPSFSGWGGIPDNNSGNAQSIDAGSNAPTISSITDIGGDSTVYVPTNGGTTTKTYTLGTVKDQYGVSLTNDASWDTATTSNGVSFSNGTLTVPASSNRSNDYTVTLKEKCGSVTKTKTVTIKTFDYKVTFYDENGTTVLKSEQTVDYGASATAPSNPSKAYDSSKHYTFAGWTGDGYTNLTSGKQTRTVKASYTGTAHSYGSWSADTATCTSGGSHYRDCTSCSYRQTESTSALGHSPQKIAAVAATCTTAGNNEYYKCTRCNKYFTTSACTMETTVAAQTIPAQGHDFSGVYHNVSDGKHNRKCSRCSAYGLNGTVNATEDCSGGTANCVEPAVCQHCNTAYGSVNSSNHKTTENRAAVAATCTTGGYTAGVFCTACNTWVSGHTAVGATGHSEGSAWVTDGSQHWKVCTVCGVITTAKADHTFGEWSTNTATCTAGGSHYRDCSVCSYRQTENTNQLGHDFTGEYHNVSVGTHNRKCSRCSAYGLNGTVNATENCSGGTANCVDKAVCTKCSTAYGNVDSTNHKTTENRAAVAPTCTAVGYTAGVFCTACEKWVSGHDAVSAQGHNFVDICVNVGAGKHYYKCTRCDAFGVNGVENATENCSGGTATCTSKAKCSTCQAEYGSLDSSNHNYGEWTKVDDTNHQRVCSYNTSHVETAAHSWNSGTVTTQPTCTGTGVKTYTCSVCNGTKTETVSANGHTAEHHDAVAATCLEAGNIEYWTCSVCNKYFSDENCTTEIEQADTVVAANGHSESSAWTTDASQHWKVCSVCDAVTTTKADHTFGSWSTDTATCTAGGSHYRECTVCSYRQTENTNQLGHDFTSQVQSDTYLKSEATCEAKAVYYYKCSRCDAKGTETYEFGDVLGHDFTGAYHNVSDGKHNRKCSRCAAFGLNGTVNATEDCSGGTANCVDKAVCTKCNTAYGSVNAGNHKSPQNREAVAATCTTGGYTAGVFCTACEKWVSGHEEVAKLGHDWQWVTDTEPTCLEAGEKHEKCSRCDATQNADTAIDALGHDYQFTETVAPTCTLEGYDLYTCSRCSATENRNTVAAPGHDWSEWTQTSAPTCLNKGEETRECGRCHLTETREVAALGHDLVDHEAKAATCTAIGWNAYQTCTRCDYTTYVEIPAAGHTPAEAVVENNVDPTCLNEGSYDSVVYCSVCDAELSREAKTVDALGHDYQAVVTAPTCTAQGYTTYTCSRCTHYYIDNYVNALGHDFGEWTQTSAPTCLNKGEETRECGRCHLTETREVVALGHDLVDHEAKAATCTAIGWNAYQTCTRCDYTTYVEIPAAGHTPAEAVVENNVDPTCLNEGSYDSVVYCSVCDAELSREAKTVDALGHDYQAVVTAPTCTAQGYTTYTCSRCTHYYIDNYVNALGHDFGDWTQTVAPTCLNKGEETRECSRCDVKETKEVEALGHDLVAHEAQAPTCTEIGWDAYNTCSRCDYTTYVEKEALGHDLVAHEAQAPTCTEIGWDAYNTCSRCDYTTYVEKEALGHDYQAVVTAPTCTAQGYTTYTCSRCTHYYIDNYVNALGHDFGDWTQTVAPTCLNKGERTRECSRCDVKETKEVEALGHDLVAHEAQAPTCTEIGWDAYNTCSRCDYTTYVEKEALGHDLVAHEAQAPTCTEIGWDAYNTCSRCDYTTYVEKEALGHDLVAHEAQAPTCTAIGWDAYNTCSRCDYTTYVEKEALGHDLVAHEAQAPTCTEIGWDAYNTCSRCDYTTYVEKEALGHDLVAHEAQAPTCTEIGWDAYNTCSRCDYTTYVEKEALGHDLVAHEAQAPTCTEIGWDAYNTCSRCDYTTYVEKEALGHDLVAHEAQAPTCTEIGWDAYNTCSRCDYTTYVEKEALGHELVAHEAQAPTCTAIGWNAYQTCTRCDYTTYVEIPAAGHTPAEAVVENNVDPTCLNEGSYDSVVYCSVCDAELSREAKTVDALGHDLVDHEAKAATCTAIGWNAYQTCTRCDYTTYVEKAALGHDYTAVVTAATCEVQGYTTHTCSRCGDNYVDAYTDAIGHSWKLDHIDDSTCTQVGTEYYVCENDAGHTRTESIALKPHETQEVPAVAAKCENPGNIKYYTCRNCTHLFLDEAGLTETTAEAVVIAALGHDYQGVVTTEPTCCVPGVKTFTCTHDAAHTYTEPVAIDPDAHHIVHVEKEDAACENAGHEAYWTCEYCHKMYTEEAAQNEITDPESVVIPAHGHEWGDWYTVDTATCTATGTQRRDCEDCEVFETKTVDMTAHTTETVNAADPTCGAAGYTGDQYCTVCHQIVQTGSVIPATGNHTSEAIPAVAATCTETGLTEGAKCSVCGQILTEQAVVPAKGHDYQLTGSQAATCTEAGYADYECSRCDETKHDVLNALGHDWGAWTVVTPATDTEDGLERRTCGRCGEAEERVFDYTADGVGTRHVKFVNINKMHYELRVSANNVYSIYNSSTIQWYTNKPLTFEVYTYSSFNYSDYIVYLNGKEMRENADGSYTIPAGEENAVITIAGAVQDDSAPSGKLSFWELLLRFIRRIIAVFTGKA